MSQDHYLLLRDRTSRSMGIEVDRVGEGYAQIRMLLREDMLNGFGMAHGGMIFAFADTCFALASNDPAGPQETITVGAGADITYIASARQGQVLVAEGSLRAHAGRSGIYDIQVRADDVLIAEFRGRSRTIPNRLQDHGPEGGATLHTVPVTGPGTESENLASVQEHAAVPGASGTDTARAQGSSSGIPVVSPASKAAGTH